jgi:uncharacterized membrane protein
MGNVLKKPSQVKIAVYLLLAYLATSCVFGVYSIFGLIRSEGTPILSIYFCFMGLVVALAIGTFLVGKISNGKNWARTVILIFFIFITLRYLYGTAIALPGFPLRLVGELLSSGYPLCIIGMIFLFRRPSNS